MFLFSSFPPHLAASSPLCDEEATTMSKTVELGFDLQGK